ncbi:hypothetical protein Ancab_021758 [Ancistrocladus abbreviatus]
MKKNDQRQKLLTWKPPHLNHYKINTDAASNKMGKVGLSFVIRDSRGLVSACGCHPTFSRGTSMVLDAMAIRFALTTIKTWEMTPLMIETDALQLVTEWSQTTPSENELSLILSDIKEIAIMLEIEVISYCPGEANRVAHSLARSAIDCLYAKVWKNCLPIAISKVLLKDLCALE